MNENPFIGSWRLLEYAFSDENGNVSHPFGEQTSGLIMYDSGGNMSVQIIRSDTPPFESGDPLTATPEEIRTAYSGINTYFGTYTISESEGKITHHLIAASLPNRRGSDQVRYYEFSADGKRLTLKAPPRLLDGKMLTGRLVWERL